MALRNALPPWLLIGAAFMVWPIAAHADTGTGFIVCADAQEHVVVDVDFGDGSARRLAIVEVPAQRVVKTFERTAGEHGAPQHWRGPRQEQRTCYRIEGDSAVSQTGNAEWRFEQGPRVTVLVVGQELFASGALIGSAILGAIGFPKFSPWPPPQPTTRRVIPRTLVTGRAVADTWGEVSDRFDNALDRVGYTDLSYYAVPDGFAIATRVERIESDGAPAPEAARWADVEARRLWTLEALLRELVGAPLGHYRTIVFVFSPDAFRVDGNRITEAQAEQWRKGGVDRLPASLRGLAYGDGFRCDALVYEFLKRDQGHRAVFVPGGLSAEAHLSRSRILEALEQLP